MGSPTIAPVQRETRTIPIVFVNVADPVGLLSQALQGGCLSDERQLSPAPDITLRTNSNTTLGRFVAHTIFRGRMGGRWTISTIGGSQLSHIDDPGGWPPSHGSQIEQPRNRTEGLPTSGRLSHRKSLVKSANSLTRGDLPLTEAVSVRALLVTPFERDASPSVSVGRTRSGSHA